MAAYRRALGLAGGLILALILFVGLAWRCGWDDLWCVHTDIDIHTGQVRHLRYAGFVLVRETIEPTAFSSLAVKCAGKTQEAEWKRVTTRTWVANVFTSYKYHSAINDCKLLMLVFKAFPVSDSAKCEYVRECLRYLRDGQIDKMNMLAMDAWTEQEAKASAATTDTVPAG